MTVRELCHALDMECDNPRIADWTVVIHAPSWNGGVYEWDVAETRTSNLGRPTFIIRVDPTS